MKMRKMELLVLLLAVSLITATANADITSGLVGYWALDEGGGTTAYDSTLNDYDGTFVDSPQWDNGPEGFGGALLLEVETLDGVYCGTECNPSAGTGKFTLAMWVKWGGTKEDMHLLTKSDAWSMGSDTMMWQWEVYKASQAMGLTKGADTGSGYDDAILTNGDFLPVGEWIHLAITFDGTNALLYADGVADPDNVGPKDFTLGLKTDAQFLIGRNTTNENFRARSFDGYIDEVRVYNRVLTQADIQELLATDTAVNIEPKNGEPFAEVGTDLVWDKPTMFTPTKYDLYCKVGDPNFTEGIVTEELGIIHTEPCNVYTPSAPFANEVTVYWRVDSYYSDTSDPCIGNVWHFDTAPAAPVVTEDPVSLTVAVGGTAVFTVEHVNGETFVWKRQSDTATVGGNSAVLTLTDVQEDPCEDSYYCVVSNTSGSAPPSAAATLWTERLIAHWDFEGNLDDSEGDWDGFYTDPNVLHDDPTAVYDLGLDSSGLALQLAADPCHVRILGSEDFFNFYPLGYSANVWIKTVQSGWGCMASKQDRTEPDYYGWALDCGEGGIWNGLREVGSVSSSGSLNDDQWHMVTATYDAEAGVITTYVDGEPVGSDTSTDIASTNAYPVVFGAEFTDGQFAYEGLLDSVGIYSYAISPLDVAVLYTDVMTDVEICVGGNPENDLSGNCRVDIEDFAILATSWLECNLVPDSLCP